MNLLNAKLYDPSTAVTNKATSAALAMTAFDTTNLRLTVTVPAHGMIRVRMCCVIHGATTCPQILLGVLDGSTVRGRVAPVITASNLAATTMYQAEADFVITGLTPGSMTLDAAYGVETVVASTNIKYGGPNNTSTNDAWGAFVFEIWDPQSLKTGLDGGVNVTQFGGTNGTFASGRPEVNTTHFGGSAVVQSGGRPEVNVSHFGGAAGTFAGGRPETNTSHWGGTAVASAVVLNAANIGADAITAAKIADGAIDAGAIAADAITAAKIANGAIDAATFAAGAIDAAALAADAGTEIAAAVWANATRTLTANPGLDAAGVRAAVGLASANLDTQLAAIDSDTAALEARLTAGRATNLDNLDAAISSRLATLGYTAPDNAGITTLLGRLTALRAAAIDSLDAAISSRLAAADYTAPDNAGIAAVQAKTDQLSFSLPNKIDGHIMAVAGNLVQGDGTELDPWRAL